MNTGGTFKPASPLPEKLPCVTPDSKSSSALNVQKKVALGVFIWRWTPRNGDLNYNVMSEDRQSGASSPADLPEISDDLIRSFKSLYLPSYRPPIYRKLHGSGWQCHHQGWYTEAAHRGHLAQRWINGYPGHSYTKFVAFDLDRHNGEDDREIYAHADAIAKAVDADLVRVQSSESRGLHLYAFLAEPVWTIRATTHTRDLLKASNVPCPEIYPSGTKNFRVPFGLGSFLLDQTYEPVSYSNVDSFLAFYEKLRREQVDRLTIPAAPKASPDADNLPRRAIGDELSPYMRDVDLLMTGECRSPRHWNACGMTSQKPGTNRHGFSAGI